MKQNKENWAQSIEEYERLREEKGNENIWRKQQWEALEKLGFDRERVN
jgi:Holliday junction resolvasome RuvABC DNA-binding subunit